MSKRLLATIALLCGAYYSFSQSIGIGVATADPSAILHVSHSSKGVLLPRMGINAITSIPNPATGLMAYDSLGHRLLVNRGTPTAPDWRHIAFGNVWNLDGNSATNPSNQFIGTTDNQPLRFRINNIPAGELHPVTRSISWGLRAGSNNTTGANNIAIGTDALRHNTTRGPLVAIGDSALFTNGLNASQLADAMYNTAIGSKTLYANTTGNSNTAVGYRTLTSNTTGNQNTAAGFSAMYFNASGNSNSAYGYQSLYNNTTGGVNTAIGYQAMYSNISGADNTVTGYQSLFHNNGGHANTAIGTQALFSNNGSSNTAVGYRSLYANAAGSASTAVGFQALHWNQSSNNTAIGNSALYNNTSGVYNTAVGSASLLNNSTGSSNTAIGLNALYHNGSDGHNNTAIGAYALDLTAASQFNTAIGYAAGRANPLGWNNTFIGAGADGFAGIYNAVGLGMNSICTGNSQVRLGNTSTSSIVGQVGYSTQSDGRFKRNIKENVKGIDFIMRLRPVTYELDIQGLNKKLGIADTNTYYQRAVADQEKTIFTGFIAQEVERAAVESGYEFSGVDKPKNDQDLYALRYAEFVVPLVKAAQEQQLLLDTLQANTQAMKKVNAEQAAVTASLLKRVEALEAKINEKR